MQSKYYSPTVADGKTFVLVFLRLVNNCVESIYKTQKTRTKVSPSAMVGEQYLSLLRLVDRLYTVIHKTQKTRTKVLPSATVGE